MQHPFQCLLVRGPSGASPAVLVAAAGYQLHSYDLADGSPLSIWPEGTGRTLTKLDGLPKGVEKVPQIVDNGTLPDESARELQSPRKRQKLSQGADESQVETNGGTAQLADESSLLQLNNRLAIIRLTMAHDGRHVVAVTGEDKCIRVFELEEGGRLSLLSERYMLKRPCAVKITSEDSRIICADKFGDVHSLPLLTGAPDSNTKASSMAASQRDPSTASPRSDLYKPAASEKTVHTLRNQKALKDQMKRANEVAERKTLDFNHRLLLGHVSMLTDVALAIESPAASSSATTKSYILTSDRDEHIRVSRDEPQAHVIEGYCLGHTEFVSRMCIPSWEERSLISGGGDGDLLLWDWRSGTCRDRVNLTKIVSKFAGRTDSEKCAVSGIWSISNPSPVNGEITTDGKVLVACEAIPALFSFQLTNGGTLNYERTLPLAGNLLDLALCEWNHSVIVSVDNLHAPFSRTEIQKETSSQAELLQTFGLDVKDGSMWRREESNFDSPVRAICDLGNFEIEEARARTVKDLLYNIENLRKRGIEE